VVPRIEEALNQCDIGNTAVVEYLIAGLRRLGGPLSAGIRARPQAVQPSWLRDLLLW
jgi:hypothetical protein